MGVPGWLIKAVMEFLEERELILRYKGGCSSKKSLPGESPQGTRLGLFLFLILINDAGYNQVERNVGSKITQSMNKRKPLKNIHLKYIDDLSLAEAINLKEKLVVNPDPPDLSLSMTALTISCLLTPACFKIYRNTVRTIRW